MTPSWMRAPPLSFSPMIGAPARMALSMMRHILAACVSDRLPPYTAAEGVGAGAEQEWIRQAACAHCNRKGGQFASRMRGGKLRVKSAKRVGQAACIGVKPEGRRHDSTAEGGGVTGGGGD
jgi:hypothetical protein